MRVIYCSKQIKEVEENGKYELERRYNNYLHRKLMSISEAKSLILNVGENVSYGFC